VTVPAFDCDVHADGTPVAAVPTTNFTSNGVPVSNPTSANFDGATGKCDRPNMLNQQCDPGSKFQVLFNDPNALVVAHCRARGSAAGNFKDIAVIQYNKTSGATCFYQNTLVTMSGVMPAPSSGDTSRWLSPNANLAGDPCVNCHDDGPIIRSPYLTQITGRDALPADIFPMNGSAGEQTKRNLPYYFVGNNFSTWRSYKVDVPGGLCVSCHDLARNNQSNLGTAIDFAQRATASTLPQKNANSANSPPWMIPGQTSFNSVWRTHANLVTNCASSSTTAALPYNANCRISRRSKYPSAVSAGSPIGFERQSTIAGQGVNNVLYSSLGGPVMELAAMDGGSFGQGNLSSLFGAPVASSPLTGVVTADSYNAFYYRNGTHLYEVAFKDSLSSGWAVADITALTQTTGQFNGNPAAYVPRYLTVAVVGGVSTGHIHRYEINLAGTSWSVKDISAAAAAPTGTRPFGFLTSDGYDDVIYVSFTGQIWELSTKDGVTWGKYNISAAVGGTASGAARPYLRSDGVNAIVYRDPSNRIIEISVATGGPAWIKRDLFTEAGTTQQTISDAVPYIRADGTNCVLFIDSATQHLFELERSAAAFRSGGSGWVSTDLTAVTGAPVNPALSGTSFASGYTRSDGVTTVVFRESNGKIHQLRHTDGGWQPYNAAVDSLTPNGP
jgi:hypothetical protein